MLVSTTKLRSENGARTLVLEGVTKKERKRWRGIKKVCSNLTRLVVINLQHAPCSIIMQDFLYGYEKVGRVERFKPSVLILFAVEIKRP
jgi:hypothetical protein